MVGAGVSCKYLFDLRPGDVYWWVQYYSALAVPAVCVVDPVLSASMMLFP